MMYMVIEWREYEKPNAIIGDGSYIPHQNSDDLGMVYGFDF